VAQTKAESDSSAVTFLDLRIFMEHFDQQNQKKELELEPQRLVDFELDLNMKSIEQRARRKSSNNYFAGDFIDFNYFQIFTKNYYFYLKNVIKGHLLRENITLSGIFIILFF